MIKLIVPIEATQKYDGFRVQAHVGEGRVEIVSEDGGNVTKRFPTIVKQLQALGEPSLILDAEITGKVDGKHMGRSKVSGYAHSKDPADDSPFTLNAFYTLMMGGADLHKLSLQEERKHRQMVKSKAKGKDQLNIDMGIVADTDTELRKAIVEVSKKPGSEGAMLKAMDSPYPLSGNTTRWLKAKKQWDIDGEVLDVHRVEGTDAYNYLMILRGPGGKPVPLGRTYNVRFERDGRAYQVPIGGIIRITFGNLNKYTDPKTGEVWYNAWSPKAAEHREEKKRPDGIDVANQLVGKSKGEVASKPYPQRYRVALKQTKESIRVVESYQHYLEANYPILYELDEYEKFLLQAGMSEDDLATARRAILASCGDEDLFWDDYLSEAEVLAQEARSSELRTSMAVSEATLQDVPAGGATNRTLWEHHWRKDLSVHLDHRWAIDGVLNGVTIADQPGPGEVAKTKKQLGMEPDDPVDTETEAKKLEGAIEWKFDPKKPEAKVLAFLKAAQPKEWLMFKGLAKPGEVGATAEAPGYFYHVEKGKRKEFGVQKIYFHEYFEYGNRYKGRWILRKLPARKEWEKVGKGKLVWLAWWAQPDFDSQIPYLLTRRGRTKRDWVPPAGVPGIPTEWQQRIPTELKWWTDKKLSPADRMKRIDLAFNHLAETMEKFPFRAIKAAEQKKAKWTLIKSWWKGPTVVRGMPSTRWELFLEDLTGGLLRVEFDQNPAVFEKVLGVMENEKTRPPGGNKPEDWLTFEGEVPAAHPRNPNEKLPMFYEILDSGDAKVIEQVEGFVHMDMGGKRLKGRRTLKVEDPKAGTVLFEIPAGSGGPR